jgi:hypothetical protein
MSTPKPRRARARWLQGAPEYVLDVFDHGSAFADQYTVFFGGSLAGNTEVYYLALSDYPDHPQGVSMWGEMSSSDVVGYRASAKRDRIRWLDLPENVRKHVVQRCQ